MRCQSAISTPPLRTLPPPPVQRPPLSFTPILILPSSPSLTPPSTLIQLTFHFPLQLPKPLPSHLLHSPSFSSRRASRNLKGLAWIMPMTKRAAGVSWLWPSSRPCFEHNFSVRLCSEQKLCGSCLHFRRIKIKAQAGGP